MKSFLTFIISLIVISHSTTAQLDSAATVNLTLYNSQTGEPLTDYNLNVINANNSKLDFHSVDTCSVSFNIPLNGKSTITASLDGFFGTEHIIDPTAGISNHMTYEIEFFLEPHTTCCTYPPLPPINFKFNSHELSNAVTDSLQFYLQLMEHNPSLIFQCVGYRTPDEYKILSIQRAAVVKNWLVEKGIDQERMEIWGEEAHLPIEIKKRLEISPQKEKSIVSDLERKVTLTIIKFE